MIVIENGPVQDLVNRQPGDSASKLFGSRWTLFIVQELAVGPRRFCQLQVGLKGISPRTLSERLRWLETEEIVSRAVFPDSPPRVEYSLTEKGKALRPVLLAMRDYEEVWDQAN